MGALRFPGFSDRLGMAMMAAGYVTAAGRPDVPAFLRVCPFDPRVFYAWLRGRVPELDTLTRLAAALGVSRAWLLLGDGAGPALVPRRTPRERRRGAAIIAGGSANTATPPVGGDEAIVPLIRRVRRPPVYIWGLPAEPPTRLAA
jgi:hypothetical protein